MGPHSCVADAAPVGLGQRSNTAHPGRPYGPGLRRGGDARRLWDLESGKEIATFTGEADMSQCVFTPDGRTIIAGDSSGRVHFLRLVEADPTKPQIDETKIQFLHRDEPATDS